MRTFYASPTTEGRGSRPTGSAAELTLRARCAGPPLQRGFSSLRFRLFARSPGGRPNYEQLFSKLMPYAVEPENEPREVCGVIRAREPYVQDRFRTY